MILALKARGHSQREIAGILGTTVANVCILEKRAKNNLAKAVRTVELAKRLVAPAVVKVKRGDDIMQIPKLLMKKADEMGIKLKTTTPDIISEIREHAGKKIKGRRAKESFEVAATRDGEVIVR